MSVIDNVRYTVSGSVASVSGFTGFPTNVTIQSIIIINSDKSSDTYNVTSIGNGAFEYCSSLSSITIPSSVTSIGNGAFRSCTSLSSITIPSSVTSIGANAFSDCSSLSSVNIQNPSNITTINTNSFTNVSSNPNSMITFNTIASFDDLSSTWKIIARYYAIINPPPPQIPPTITNFPNIYKTRQPNDPPFNFTLQDPSSNSSGTFSYTSSVPSVASVSGKIVTVYKDGSSNIVALQDACGNYTSGSITSTLFVSNICFPAGTLITTDQGIIAIEKINPDIHTIHGKKIVGITQTISSHDFLICFEKHALGKNIPSQRTCMTHGHEVLYNGQMRKAIEFVHTNDHVYKTKYRGDILYNVLMETHEIMEVNQLHCETLNPVNPIAKLYNLLKECTPEQQKRLAKEYNEYTIKNNKFTPKQLKHLNKCL